MKTITSLGCPVSKEMFASERLFSDYGLYTYAVINVTSTNLTYLGERKKLTDLYSEMSATDLVSPVGFVFNGFNRAFPYDFPTEKLFNEVLDLVLMRSKFKKYKSDLSYNEKNRITFIKMVFRIRHGEENNSYARSNHFENVLAKSNYKGFIFDNDYFKLEQEKQTISVSISNTIMATITITLISALLIPKIKTIICITTTVFSINIGVFATLSLMGIRLDIISMITMLMSIGYSVDYATHVAFHFLIQKEQCLQVG
uniref:SSD domain-containing protein n=1 Tax=Rhabditophanes sp. KR3021 TaxID=114890 RepID=A0AC35TNH4_9BILA